MSRFCKGNEFPDLNVPGDPRLLDAINRRTPNVAGGGISHVFGSTIIIPKVKGKGKGGLRNPPAFYRVYRDGRKWYIQGGQVTGGVGNIAVEDIKIGTATNDSGAGLPSDGTNYWIVVTGDGTVTEGIVYGGFKVTAVVEGHGATMPENTMPAADAATGLKFHMLLGTWNNKQFTPSNWGHLNVQFCPGSGYTPIRF